MDSTRKTRWLWGALALLACLMGTACQRSSNGGMNGPNVRDQDGGFPAPGGHGQGGAGGSGNASGLTSQIAAAKNKPGGPGSPASGLQDLGKQLKDMGGDPTTTQAAQAITDYATALENALSGSGDLKSEAQAVTQAQSAVTSAAQAASDANNTAVAKALQEVGRRVLVYDMVNPRYYWRHFFTASSYWLVVAWSQGWVVEGGFMAYKDTNDPFDSDTSNYQDLYGCTAAANGQSTFFLSNHSDCEASTLNAMGIAVAAYEHVGYTRKTVSSYAGNELDRYANAYNWDLYETNNSGIKSFVQAFGYVYNTSLGYTP